MSERLHLYRNRRIWILLLIFISVVACQEEESFSTEEQKSILMSTGWKLDHMILYFQDGRPNEKSDTLVLITTRSDREIQQMTVYTDRWVVFINDTIALSAYNQDLYSRPDSQAAWERISTNSAGEGWIDWGFNERGMPYLGLLREWPTRIRLANEHQFTREDAYRIEIVEEIPLSTATRTYRFWEFPSGTLERIDAVYLAAGPDEGPNWFPPWSFWP
jgi:hypothetical protein